MLALYGLLLDLIDAARNVVGRPPGYMFAIIWIILVIIWALVLILAGMNLGANFALIGIGVFSLLCLTM